MVQPSGMGRMAFSLHKDRKVFVFHKDHKVQPHLSDKVVIIFHKDRISCCSRSLFFSFRT